MKESATDRREEIIREKIIDLLAVSGGGQFVVVEPETGTADLAVEKRGTYYEKETKLYLYIKECKKDLDKNIFSSVPVLEKKEDFAENSYLLFLNFDVVKQDIFEYAWLVPVNTFFVMTEPDKSGKRKFEVPLNARAENKYLNFLVEKNYLANILEEIFKRGNDIFSGGKKLEDFGDFKPEDLKKFIAEARRNTFAGDGVSVDNPRLKGSEELEFRKAEWHYQDIYFTGKNNFIGQEVVYYNARPVWAMMYFGNSMPKPETEFLKRALLDLSEKCRFGEKCELKKKDFHYEDNGEGTIERFKGLEKMSVHQKDIYKLNYQGGIIKK